MRKVLSVLVAVCMVASLNPAQALALTADEAQNEMGSWAPTEFSQTGEQNADGTWNVNTTVNVSTYTSFHATDSKGPGPRITVAESKDANTDSGRLWAKFEGGRPYTNGSSAVRGEYYKLKVSWTKDGRTSSGYTYEADIAATGSTQEVTLPLNTIFGADNDNRQGEYVFHLTLVGSDIEAEGVTYNAFKITDSSSEFTVTTLDNSAKPEQPQGVLTGNFSTQAALDVAALAGPGAPDNGNAAVKGMLDMLQQQAGSKTVGVAWQVEVVNDTLLPSPALIDWVDSVKMAIDDDTIAAIKDGFTITSVVNGAAHAVEFAGSTVTELPYEFTGNVKDADGNFVKATIVEENGKKWITFRTAGLGEGVGAFALAWDTNSGSFTITASAVNGTISHAGEAWQRPGDTETQFTLSPAEGYVLNDPAPTIVFKKGVAALALTQGTHYTLVGNTLTLKPLADLTGVVSGDSISVSVEFQPFVPLPSDATSYNMKVQLSSANNGANLSAARLGASFTQMSEDGQLETGATEADKPFPLELQRVKTGSAVTLNFTNVPEGYVISGLKVGQNGEATATPMDIAGTSFTIPAMNVTTQNVYVEFAPGVQPPILNVHHKVACIAGEGGTISGIPAEGITHGDAVLVSISANTNYAIETVKVYTGEYASADAIPTGAVPCIDCSAEAADQSLYVLTIPSVTGPLTVVATFKAGPISVNITQAEGGTLTWAGAAAGATPPFQIPQGTATFKFTVLDGYTFTGVYQGDVFKTAAELGVTESAAGAGGTFTLNITGNTTLVPVFTPDEMPDPTQYHYVTVSSDGNGTVSPEGTVQFKVGDTQPITFGTVEGKENWRASSITVMAAAKKHTLELTETNWASYDFDPAAEPWKTALGEVGPYTVRVDFSDKSADNPEPLPEPVQIAISVSEGGSVSPAGTLQADGQRIYTANPGDEQTFTFAPSTGYSLDAVWMNLGEDGAMQQIGRATEGVTLADGVLKFTPQVGKDYKLQVEFKKNAVSPKVRWKVQTAAEGTVPAGCSITPTGESFVLDGQPQEFSFIRAANCELKSVMVYTTEADSFTGVTGRDMTNMVAGDKLNLTVNANTRVVAQFAEVPSTNPEQPPAPKATFKLNTAVSGTGGTITPATAGTAQSLYVDSSLTIGFKPDQGYDLKQVRATCAEDTTWQMVPNITGMHKDAGQYSWTFQLPESVRDSFANRTVTITAEFEKVVSSHYVTVVTEGPTGVNASAGPDDATGYGYVTPGYTQGGKVAVPNGGSQEFSFINRDGYTVESVWLGSTRLTDDMFKVVNNVKTYTVTGLTADTTLRVVFKANGSSTEPDTQMFTVNAQAAANGKIEPAGNTVKPAESSLTFTITPNDGFEVDAFTVDGKDQKAFLKFTGKNASYTLAPINANHQVNATFKASSGSGTGQGGDDRPPVVPETKHTISVSVEGAGKVTPGDITSAGAVEVADGGQQSFSFIPVESSDASKVNQLAYIEITRGTLVQKHENVGGSYTLYNVTADMRLRVVFEEVDKGSGNTKPTYKQYTVTVQDAVGQGTVDPGTSTVNAGSNLTFTMTPAEGWHLSYIEVDAAGAGAGACAGLGYIPANSLTNSSYTFGNIQTNHTLRAVFVEDSKTEDKFTTYDLTQLDGTKVLTSTAGSISVKQGEPQSITLSPTYGNTIVEVKLLNAADLTDVLQTFKRTENTREPFAISLPYVEGVDRAVLQVTLGPTYGDAPVEGAMYSVTATVLPSDNGSKLGTITPAGTQKFAAGSDVTFTMKPEAGCTVDSVTANSAPVNWTVEDGYYTFTVYELAGAMNVAVKFRPIDSGDAGNPNVPETPGKLIEVNLAAQGSGKIQPASPAFVKPGNSLPITLVPNSGDAKLGSLLVDGKDVTAQAERMPDGSYTYTIENVTDPIDVKATFVNGDGTVDNTDTNIPVNVKLEVKVTGNVYGGTVDPSQPLSLTPGSSQRFVIKPANGFYASEVRLEFEDGRIDYPQVKEWKPNYGASTASAAAGARTSDVASGLTDQTASTENVSVSSGQTSATLRAAKAMESLLGVEKAYAADPANKVEKPYSYFVVENINSSFTAYITLDDCEKDPANTSAPKAYYSYDEAAKDLVTAGGSASGGATIRPSDNTDVVDESGNKTFIIDQETGPDGKLEPIKEITVGDKTIDLTDTIKPDGTQDPADVVNKVNDALGSDGKLVWVPTPAPGHYELTVNGKPGADGKWEVPPVNVEGEGGSIPLTNAVKLTVQELDAATNTLKPVDASVLDVTAKRVRDGAEFKNKDFKAAYGDEIHVTVALNDSNYKLLRIEPTGLLTATPPTREAAAQANTFYAMGNGGLRAILQKVQTVDPDDPNNPTDPTDPDDPNNPGTDSGYAVYYVTATAGEGGSISQAAPRYRVGTAAQFTITPDATHEVASVTLDGKKQDYSSTSYTVPQSVCTKDSRHTVHVEFKAKGLPAGSSENAAVKKAMRTLQSLAATGDSGSIMLFSLLAVACGAAGVALLLRRRKQAGEE